jgi:hypothetical protein
MQTTYPHQRKRKKPHYIEISLRDVSDLKELFGEFSYMLTFSSIEDLKQILSDKSGRFWQAVSKLRMINPAYISECSIKLIECSATRRLRGKNIKFSYCLVAITDGLNDILYT